MVATTLTVKSLKSYISADLNIIISGVHGVGKTAKLREACSQLNLAVKYYSAATLDPFTDLVGIPVPNTDTKTVEYFRPHEIDQAQVIFFDEINRADPKTLNTIMEIILDHSINGEPLPNLRTVVAAMNPVSADYATDELDKALFDRFDVYLQADPEVDLGYFVGKFGDEVGAAAVQYWNEYHTAVTRSQTQGAKGQEVPYISPRRLDKLVAAFVAIPARQTILDCLPPEISDRSVAQNLFRKLDEALKIANGGGKKIVDAVQEITNMSIAEQRSAATGAKVEKLLAAGLPADQKARLLTSLAIALNSSKGAATIMDQFGTAVLLMNPTQFKTLIEDWAPAKVTDLQRLMAAAK
jgi:hypothetical protein